MGAEKKKIRQNFRDTVFSRDGNQCAMCSWKPTPESHLDAHHICDRTLIPNGGYVKENGISLCPECHQKAEEFHSTGVSHPGYSPEDLYKKINSTYEMAVEESKKLKS